MNHYLFNPFRGAVAGGTYLGYLAYYLMKRKNR